MTPLSSRAVDVQCTIFSASRNFAILSLAVAIISLTTISFVPYVQQIDFYLRLTAAATRCTFTVPDPSPFERLSLRRGPLAHTHELAEHPMACAVLAIGTHVGVRKDFVVDGHVNLTCNTARHRTQATCAQCPESRRHAVLY